MTSKTVSILYNTSVYVVKFRLSLIAALKEAGYDVIVISPEDEATSVLCDQGVEHIPINMSQYGMNPAAELKSIREIEKILRRIKPLVSLHYTVKPNTFGSIAAERAGVPVINNIAGAGRAFSSGNPLIRSIVSVLYRRGLRSSYRVLFQNDDDMRLFLGAGLVREEQCCRIPGSGVDLERFIPTALCVEPMRFLFVGRLLREKGIYEYLKAANQVLASSPTPPGLEFHVVGEHENSRSYIDKRDLLNLTASSRIFFHGAVKPVRVEEFIRDATCVVLPTYYGEGVPRVLLEACASARPIITTDNVGSREVVEEGINGWKTPVRDIAALKRAMCEFIDMPLNEKEKMARAARRSAETRFDEKLVISCYTNLVKDVQSLANQN